MIVGASGVGKTTLFNLTMREISPKKGDILFCGEKIENYNLGYYLSQISIVTQDPFIFNTNIRDNFSLVNKDTRKQMEICKN